MLRLARAHPGRTAASVAVTVMMAVIVGNATLMQHGRHPAPLFAGTTGQIPLEPAPAPMVPRLANTPVAAARPSTTADEVPRRHDRSAVTVASDDTPTGVAAARTLDADVLRAQHALVKLGFDIKADGHLGLATRKALDSFASAHHLSTMSGTLSPKLLQALTAAAGKPQG